jgi:hypothetical protein
MRMAVFTDSSVPRKLFTREIVRKNCSVHSDYQRHFTLAGMEPDCWADGICQRKHLNIKVEYWARKNRTSEFVML